VAYGLHPWFDEQPLDHDRLVALLRTPEAIALGEVGLDFSISGCDRDGQLSLLADQLEIAQRLELPIILHCRKAFNDLFRLLVRFDPPLRGVLHGFSRGPELAQRLIRAGLYLSFGGLVTRPGATRAREAVATVPADRLLFETDAPEVGIAEVPPAQVEPRHVRQIVEIVARLRGASFDDLVTQTTKNAITLFSL
jgi:TatD DNase family protein